MRYLHNYKGTTLPLQADRVKNWLLSFSLGFFSIPPSRRVIYNNVGGYISPTRQNALHSESPSPHKGQTRAGQTEEAGTSFSVVSIYEGSLAAVYEQTWHTHINTHGQNASAARGSLSSINLHPAEMCEAKRLRGGQ